MGYVSPRVAVGSSLLALFAVAAAWRAWRAKSRERADDTPKDLEFQKVGTVSSLAIYPIKSCRGINVDWALCTPLGLTRALARDRVFMVTDKDGHFVTARQEPPMILIAPTFQGSQMRLDAPGMDSMHVDSVQLPPEKAAKVITCKIFGQLVRQAVDCGEEVSRWLSAYLGRDDLKLVYFGGKTSSRFNPQWNKWQNYRKTDTTVFGDLAPYLILSTASVQELNGRLRNKVSAVNFRPNILVDGCPAFDEEKWKYVKIGDKVMLRRMRPCCRCVLTTVDPETGVKDPDSEPLKTLKSYKQLTDPELRKMEGESPVFGVYMSADVYGQIRIGDPVCVAY